MSECANSSQCAPYKHHYDECVERVTRQEEDEDYNGPKEDCVEECKSTLIMTVSTTRSNLSAVRSESLHFTNIDLVFHLTHCATACAAPKLWRELK